MNRNKKRRKKGTMNPRAYQLAKYGLTEEEYDNLLDEQGGVCAICWKVCASGKRLAVDHDHACCPPGGSCGECVRGLLCQRCNTFLIGHYDVPELVKAVSYLQKNNKKTQDRLEGLDKANNGENSWEWLDFDYVRLNT